MLLPCLEIPLLMLLWVLVSSGMYGIQSLTDLAVARADDGGKGATRPVREDELNNLFLRDQSRLHTLRLPPRVFVCVCPFTKY